MDDYSLSKAGTILGVDPKTLKSWLVESHISPREAPEDKRVKVISKEELRALADRYHRAIKEIDEPDPPIEIVDPAETQHSKDVSTDKHVLVAVAQGKSTKEIDLVKESFLEAGTLLRQRNEELAHIIENLTQVIQTIQPGTTRVQSKKPPTNGEVIAGVKMDVYKGAIAKTTAAQLAVAHGADPKAGWDGPESTRDSVENVLNHVWNNLHDPRSLYRRRYGEGKNTWKECEDEGCDCHQIAEGHLQGVTRGEIKVFRARRGIPDND